MIAFHVDADPKSGKPLAEEQERILAALREIEPPMSVIIASGGGCNALLHLASPILVNENIEEIEAYNRRIEDLVGGDDCHNIDRILRIPGTINLPNKKKRDAGRAPAVARLVEADWVSPRYRYEPTAKADSPGCLLSNKRSPARQSADGSAFPNRCVGPWPFIGVFRLEQDP